MRSLYRNECSRPLACWTLLSAGRTRRYSTDCSCGQRRSRWYKNRRCLALALEDMLQPTGNCCPNCVQLHSFTGSARVHNSTGHDLHTTRSCTSPLRQGFQDGSPSQRVSGGSADGRDPGRCAPAGATLVSGRCRNGDRCSGSRLRELPTTHAGDSISSIPGILLRSPTPATSLTVQDRSQIS